MALPRPYWKGFLKLSLVTCPILVYPASTQRGKIHFHQISRKTGNRLRQQMVDEETGDIVGREDKGRGYELSEGRYVEIEPEELEAIEIESTRTIDIDKFVPASEIDRRYFDKPYYIVPAGKEGDAAFVVIRDAMKNKDRMALARIVMANREHVMALEPFGKGLLGTTLRYDYEVRPEKEFFEGIPSPRIDKEMVKLAEHILDSKAGHFDPVKFKDHYEMALEKLVRRKAQGKPIEKAAPAPKSNIIDLMEALRRSTESRARSAAKPKTKTDRRKRSPSTRASGRRKARRAEARAH